RTGKIPKITRRVNRRVGKRRMGFSITKFDCSPPPLGQAIERFLCNFAASYCSQTRYWRTVILGRVAATKAFGESSCRLLESTPELLFTVELSFFLCYPPVFLKVLRSSQN